MKEKAVIFECSADAIIDIRKRLDEIASVTNGSIWFETIGQNTINANGSSLTKYSIICHYPESQMEIRDKYYEDKVRNIQNTFKSELDSVRNKLTKYTHIIQALTGRPIDEIVKSWDMCDNGFGVNYRFNPNGRSTLDISMSRTKREVLLEKENEELKKRLKSAEQSDYVTPLRDRVDICEEKIDEHEADLEDCKEEIDLLWNNAFTGLEKQVELFNNARKEDIQELFDDMEDRKKDISEQDRRLDCHHNRLMSLSERVNTLSTQYKDSWYELQQVRKDITDLINTVCEDNKTVNNTLNDFNIRLKAIEKRLSIKLFYAPTEDEKDDD